MIPCRSGFGRKPFRKRSFPKKFLTKIVWTVLKEFLEFELILQKIVSSRKIPDPAKPGDEK